MQPLCSEDVRGPVSHARILAILRERDEPVALTELARRLLCAPGPPEAGLARRVVGTALGRAADALPDPVPPTALGLPAPREIATPLEQAEFAVVDLETTGLSPDRCAILEIGAVRVVGLELADRYETFVKPWRSIPSAITRLTGIRAEMVAGAPPPRTALRRFQAWLARSPNAVFVAHNAGFDERFLRAGLAATRLPPMSAPVLCTRRLARAVAPELRRFSLESLCEGFGINHREPHRALADAEAAALALVEMVARARRDKGIETVGELFALQRRARKTRRRPARGPDPKAAAKDSAP